MRTWISMMERYGRNEDGGGRHDVGLEPLRGGAILGAGGVGVAADAESGGRGRRAAEGQPTTELLSNPAPHPAGSRDATGATLSAPAAGRSNLTTANRRPPAHEAKGKPKKEPGSPRAAAPASSSGTNTRFQCPRCPKNFSRIENLTRHQANRECKIAIHLLLCLSNLYLHFWILLLGTLSRDDSFLIYHVCR